MLVNLGRAEVHGGEELVGDAGERLLGPLHEPVDGAAVDQRGELAASRPESLAHGGHAQDDVEVVSHPVDERAKEHIFRWVQAKGLGVRTNLGHHSLLLVLGKQSGNLAAVEDVVDVLEEVLLDDLRVGEQKDDIFPLRARHQEHLTQVVAPLVLPVPLRDFDREEVEFFQGGGQSGERLPPAAADAEQQRVAQRQPDDAADPRHVLDGVQEHHEFHRRSGLPVVIVERLLDDALELAPVLDPLIHAGLGAGDHVIAVDKPVHARRRDPVVVVGLLGRALGLGQGDDLVPTHAELFLRGGVDQIAEPLPVLVVHHPVLEDPQVLVHPQAVQLIPVLGDHARVSAEQALEHPGEISQVERVVRLGGRREQISSHRVVDVNGGFAYWQREGGDVLVELLREVRFENGVEDSDGGLVGHVGEAEEVEVPEHPVAHRVATTARRAHATHDDHVLQGPERARGMALVPAAVVHPLPQKFDGRLGEILLAHRHVKIVNEDRVLLTHRRPEHALSPLVHLRVEEVLRLISRRARAERHEHRDVQVRHVVVELVHDVQGLAGAGVAHAEHVLVVQEQLVDDVCVPHRIRRGHDNGSESLVRIGLVLRYGLHPLDPFALVLVVAVLVHARVALALGRHEIGEFVLLGFLTEKLLQLRPAGTCDGRAEGPNHREDPEGNRGFVRVPPLFAAERLLALHRVPHVPLEQRGHQVELPLHEARVHRGHSLLQVLSHEEHDALHAGHDRLEDLAELIDVRLEQIGQRLQVGVEQRRQTHRGRLHVNHATSRNRRRGRHRQVLNLEDHVHQALHGDDLARVEAQLLVIVQHGVHVLDPDGVHGAVEHDPLTVWAGVPSRVAKGHGEDAVGPLLAHRVLRAVQLAHGDGFGVQAVVLDLLFPVQTLVVQLAERIRENGDARRLHAVRLTHEHQAVTHDDHLVQLDDLLEEGVEGLELSLGAGVAQGVVEVVVVNLRQFYAGE
mmetsp:Transcript_3151/g.13663  ORF Transcript_3151/g.13663 Transcript_3151/m.13663 type:complete len:966 (+) Transcript_3151:6936-9833(+)